MRSTAARGKTGASRFASIPSVSAPRSAFNRSHGHKTTFDGGFLIPVAVDELLPGDTYKCTTRSFIRLLTPLYPIMDTMYLDCFWFFVPNRLLWVNWEKFMGAQDDPGDSIDFTIPTISFAAATGHFESSIYDYMGLPCRVDLTDSLINPVSALHFRAYNLIYKEWFRPEDIVDSPDIETDNGPDTANTYTLLRRAKRHDYFTAALPFAQKGSAVTLPLGTSAPVTGTIDAGAAAPTFISDKTTPVAGTLQTDVGTALDQVEFAGSDATGAQPRDLFWDTPNLDHTLIADLSTATAATINAIREATTLQQFQEREARGGTRYTEQITSMFGVRSPDARLQRPEYLGGCSDVLNVSPVAATNQNTGPSRTLITGDLAAYVTGGNSHGASFTYSATEHGVVLGLASVRANLTYQQGTPRMWSRQTRFDFAWPIFASLGEQEVLNKEIYTTGNNSVDNDVFGYQERYAEYRYAENRLSGLFRSSSPASLDAWHLAQDFSSLPALNEAFIEEDPPFLRTVAVQNEDMFKADFWFDINHVRPLPMYSVPGLQRF